MFEDSPIDNMQDDKLDIKHFIDALVETIITVPTPYTISLYGEWGSGKTSILKIVERTINDKKERYKCIWINAW